MTGRLALRASRALALAALLVLAAPAVPLVPPALAQTAPQPAPTQPAPTAPAQTAPAQTAPAQAAPAESASPASNAPDYAAWEVVASRIEEAVEDSTTSDEDLSEARAQLVDWRDALQQAQNANATRIATLRQQIAALGAVPAEGEVEAPEIAQRRAELTDQLVRLQAPGIAAEEAYSRADALIREIDRIRRERQADELLQHWPSPLNPANWPEAARAVGSILAGLQREVSELSARPAVRSALVDRAPVLGVVALLGLAMLLAGPRLVRRLAGRIREASRLRGRNLLEAFVSLGEVVVPAIGLTLVAAMIGATGYLGPQGLTLVASIPLAGFTVFAARWLAGRIFGDLPANGLVPLLTPARRRGARLLLTALGLVQGIELVRMASVDPLVHGEAASSVLVFPVLLVAGLLLARFGQILKALAAGAAADPARAGYGARVLGLVGRAVTVIGLAGPVLAAVGYVAAAQALIFPAITSLGLVAALYLMQRLAGEIYVTITGEDETKRDALLPVLVGFGLSLLSVPLFALIWGARTTEIVEVWARFQEGFQIGATRISPSDFLYFLVIFALGYMLTKLAQGFLRGSILPRTQLDPGGQNAVVAGTGYVGIFLAGLVAINTAGIDLSGLAIVAGALSLGLGFGLQNIVQNFVSGIILLIERPVSEGDWIEVAGVQGTVKAISVRSTRIQTFDRNDVIVPNAELISGRVTNWTRFNLTGRLIVPVGVAFGSDTRQVERVLRKIAEAQPMVLMNPEPAVIFMGFGPDSMNFEIRVILRDVNFSLSVRSEMNHQIVAAFAAERIEIPSSQQDVTLRNVEALGEALRGLAPAAALAPPATSPVAAPAAALPAAAPARPAVPPPPRDLPEPQDSF